MVVEQQYSLHSEVPSVGDTSAGEIAETLTLFYNDVAGEMLQECLCYSPKRNHRDYAE